MKTASLFGGIVSIAVGIAGAYDDIRLSGTSQSWIDAHVAGLPVPYLSHLTASTIVFGLLGLAGVALFLNGLRSQTKLSITEIRQLNLINNQVPKTTIDLVPHKEDKERR